MSEKIQELIDSNDFLSSLLNNITSAIIIIDKNFKVQKINKSFRNLFQKSEEDVYNKNFGNIMGCVFHVKEEANCGELVNCNVCKLRYNIIKCLTEKVDSINTLIKQEFFIGNEFVLKYFYTTTKYFEYKGLEYIFVIIFDITELETKNKLLKELNDLKNEFLGIAAHDLRNPITEIMMASSILSKYTDKLNKKERTRLIDLIQKSSDFMLNLVNNLLDISKIESGKLELELTRGNYVDFIDECLVLNRLNAIKKKITIELASDDDIPNVNFDKTKIRQVIDNLIGNAIKFSSVGAKIIVIIERNPTQVITKVIDEGPGILQSELSLLFKEFQKISTKSIDGEKSTGLGLAIVKKIVEKHNGQIGVKSEVGKGSTFYFSLPIS